MQKASFLMREEVAHGVQVLGKLRDAGQVARLSGEKRAKVDALAQGTLRKCLMLVGRAEERRNAQEILAWIVLVFQSVRACGLDLEVIMARACSADLSAYAAPALLYAVAQAFGASSASSQPSQANAQGTSTSGLNEAFLRMLTQVCRFALLCHTCEASQHVGISPESLSAAMASSADPLRAVLGKYSTCRAITEPVVEKSSRFASALSKVLQQLAYCSAEQGSLLCAPKMLAQLLVPFAEMGWLSRRRQVDDVGSARCPWRVTCSGVEATLEFMLQRGDRLGIQGCEVAFLFLKKTQDWPLGDHHFLLQIAALVLRCAAEPIVEASSKFAATTSRHTRDVPSISKSTLRDGKSHQPVEADDTPSMQHLHRLLRLFTDCLQGTFKADRRRGANAATPTAHGLAAALALQASGASSYLGRRRGGSRRARHLDASSSGAQALSVATQGWLHHESQSGGLYLGAHEKAVMDVVTGIAFAIFRLHAQEQAQGSIKPKARQSLSARTMGSSEHQRQDIPMATNDFEAPLLKEELGRAAESCFARLGPSDLHWKTIWAVGSKQVFATGWSSSEFEVCAAVLRSAVACAAQNPSKLALRGMAAALHELAQDELTSVQQLLRQSQKYHPEVAASGEYTIAVYGARLSVFLVFLINASPESVLSPSHAEANANPLSMMSGSASQDTMVGQVASALLSLVQRACSARAVYELPLEVVLSWLPAVGVALGSAVDAISSAARSAILEILQSVAVRGSAVCEDADRNSNSHMNRPKFDSSAPGRRADMDAVTLRLLEVWHALFATGAAPGWMNEAFGDVCEIDPLPFSDTYTKDLMLMITQHHKLARQAAPSWFKPLIAARQLQAIGQSLEADLRANLLPFRTFPGSFMNGSEQAALSLASELIVPRLGSLTRAMDDYAIAWQTQHMSRRGAQDSLLRLAALQAGVPAPSAVISEDSGAAGSLGTAVHALQGLAEIFARFDCARGRLSAAFYMHSAALLLRESGDAWEAGNAFATVANCILGKSFDTEDSTGQDVSGAALHTTDALHTSIAAAFLRESIASFALMGAHPEAHRIKAILEQVSGRGDRPSRAPSLAPMGPPDLQEAISYYFLVGRASTETHEHARHWGHASPKYRQVHPWARVALSTSLCVARVIANARGPLDEIGKAETALVERLQRGTGLALAEGRLEWETREVWEASSTNTAQKSRLVIQAVLNSLGPERDGAIGKEAFYVRRLWPVRQWQKTAPMLRCPGEFVLLPNALDETPRSGNASPLESAGRGLLNGAGAFEDSKPRPSASQILLRTQESLSPTVALCSCDATLLPDDGPSAEDLLRASPFGDPLGPLAPPPDLRLGSRDEEFYPRRQGEVEGEEEEVGDEVDVEMEFDDVDPIPPDYPPPGFANADDMRPPSNSPPGARGTGRVGPDLSQVFRELSGSSRANLRAAEAQPPRTPKGMMPRQDSYSSVISEMSEKLRDRRKIVDEAVQQESDRLESQQGSNDSLDESSNRRPKDKEASNGDDQDDESETRPLLPPKPARLLQGGFDAAEGKTPSARHSSVAARRASVTTGAVIGCENPLTQTGPGSGQISNMPRWPQRTAGGLRKSIGGIPLADTQSRAVEQSLKDQIATFHGSIVDKAGLKEIKLQIIGRLDMNPNSSPGFSTPKASGNASASDSPPASSPRGTNRARRRSSIIATVRASASKSSSGRQRGGSSASATPLSSDRKPSTPGADTGMDPPMSSVGGSSSNLGKIEPYTLQVLQSKTSGGLMRRQSQTFKAIDTFGLQQAQISETSVPGVVKIVNADRAKRGENPMLFRTDQPIELIAFVQALQAGQTQS